MELDYVNKYLSNVTDCETMKYKTDYDFLMEKHLTAHSLDERLDTQFKLQSLVLAANMDILYRLRCIQEECSS